MRTFGPLPFVGPNDDPLCQYSKWLYDRLGTPGYTGSQLELARLICGRCALREPCRAYALEHGERFSMWGGLTWNERRNMLQRNESASA